MTKKSLKIFGQGGVGEDISRRDFLKLAGAASAAGIAGCADSPRQKILPFVEGDEDQIPGVAVWYRTSCSECAAGCGIQVRTRDGRAVKIEGNPDHPINKGGVCAIGHSALQDLYDPDRVRQPLKRVKGSGGEDSFEPISWKEAYSKISAKLKKQGKGKRVLFSGGTSGAQSKLIKDWSAALGVEHYVFAPTDPVAVAKASELTFDKYGVPTYRFDQADVIINFGADFMESWLSPVEFSRGWADSRKSSHPVKVVHVEPRLSLTGANADLWINSKPGHELMLVLALMKVLYRRGRLAQLKRNIALKVKELTQGIDIKKVSSDAGIKHEKLLLMAQYLEEAKSPLVIAGGAVGTGTNALDLQVATNLLSLMVGSIGRTVFPDDTRAPQTDLVAFKKLIDTVNKGKQGLDLAFITGTNPEYNLPESFGFKYALKKCDLVVSFSSHLDETTRLADIIIPSHTPLESWRDQTPRKGIHNLLQPVMQPVFDTKQLEDQLLDIAAQAGVKGKVTSASNFEEYLKSEWQELFNAEGGAGDFEKYW